MSDNFHANSTAFTSWLTSSGATVSPKIELVDLRQQNAGRGVVAREDIEEDEVLFSVPRNIVLSVDNSAFAREYKQLLDSLEEDPWLSLILIMMYEYGRGSLSPWKPYFDVLPSEFDTLMYWTPEELSDLQASAVVKKIGRPEADETFKQKILPIVGGQPALFGFSDRPAIPEEILVLAHRMGSLIMAYAFDIEPDPEKLKDKELDEEGYMSEAEDEDLEKGMVPLADMLNADAERNNARLFYESDALVMKALKPVQRGEELFNDYGPLPRSDLLRRYGYITENYRMYDVVEIPLDLVVETAKKELGLDRLGIEQRMSHLEDLDALEDGYDISRASPTQPAIDIFSSTLKMLGLVLLPEFQPGQKISKQASRNEFSPLWYALLGAVVKRRQKEFQTTLDDDRQYLDILKQRIGGLGFHDRREIRRRIMATEVRIGEKEILSLALTLLEQAESSNSSRNSMDARAAGKRSNEAVENGSRAKKRK